MLMLGLVFGEWLLAAGVIALVVTLVGWLVDARGEYVKTVEADSTGHLENIPPPRAPVRVVVAWPCWSSPLSSSRPAGSRRAARPWMAPHRAAARPLPVSRAAVALPRPGPPTLTRD